MSAKQAFSRAAIFHPPDSSRNAPRGAGCNGAAAVKEPAGSYPIEKLTHWSVPRICNREAIIMRFLLWALATMAAPLLSIGAALAQTGLAPQAIPQVGSRPAESTWRISLGAGTFFGPDYPGSNDWRARFILAPDIRYGDNTFFLSFRDGVGATLLRSNGFTAGPVARLRFGRDQDDNQALRGLGDIDPSGEAGAFVSFSDGPWRAQAELRQGFGGHSGLVADARIDRVFSVRPDLILSTGPRVSWGSRDFAETYYGITTDQAARSGYQRFSPDNYWFAGVAGGATWLINQRWAASLFGEVGQILGKSADSPLVDQRGSATQGVVGLALTWRLTQ